MDKFNRIYKRIISQDTNIIDNIGTLTLNKETNRWDCDGSIIISSDDISNGTLIKPYGVIKGTFKCTGLDQLKTCNNFPTKVEENLDLANCTELEDLSGLKNCQILGQLQVGHNGKFGVEDFIDAMRPHTKIWDYVSMDADLYDEKLDMYYDQNHGSYWNWKLNRWDDYPELPE